MYDLIKIDKNLVTIAKLNLIKDFDTILVYLSNYNNFAKGKLHNKIKSNDNNVEIILPVPFVLPNFTDDIVIESYFNTFLFFARLGFSLPYINLVNICYSDNKIILDIPKLVWNNDFEFMKSKFKDILRMITNQQDIVLEKFTLEELTLDENLIEKGNLVKIAKPLIILKMYFNKLPSYVFLFLFYYYKEYIVNKENKVIIYAKLTQASIMAILLTKLYDEKDLKKLNESYIAKNYKVTLESSLKEISKNLTNKIKECENCLSLCKPFYCLNSNKSKVEYLAKLFYTNSKKTVNENKTLTINDLSWVPNNI